MRFSNFSCLFSGKYRFILLLAIFYAVSVHGQTNKSIWPQMGNNPRATFYQVQQDFNQYWQGKKIEKGKGYKVFKRWESYMAPRVYPSGDMTLPSTTYNNYINWQKSHIGERSIAGNWSELGPIGKPLGPTTQTGAGRVNFIRFDPTNVNKIYVGAPDGGLWKSTNGGSSWTTNTDFITIIGCSDLAISPANPNIMYLATGDIESDRKSIGILKSTNGGVTWNATGLTLDAADGYKTAKLLMHPNDPLTMLLATNFGVFKTTDGWVTATQVVFFENFQDMEFKPGDPNVIYGSGEKVFKSVDNGDNWVEVTTGLPNTNISRIALGVSANNPAYVYALIGKSSDQSFLGLYRSTDSGASFSLRSSSPNLLGYETDGSDNGGQAFYDLSIAVSPTNAEKVITGGVNQWGSLDGGVTWNIISHWNADGGLPFVHADVHEINFLPGNGNTFFSCNDGGLFKTIDNGVHWTDLSNNLAISQQVKIGLSTTDPNLYVAGHQDNGTNLQSAGVWTNFFGGDGGECFIDYNNNSTIYWTYVQGEMHRSDNGTMSETQITNGIPVGGMSGADFYSPFHQDPVTSTTLYAGGRPALYKSTDKGDNWTILGTPSGTGNITDFAIAPSNNTVIYAIKYDAISKSTDSGVSWTDVTGTLPVANVALTNLTISNVNANKVWVTFSGYLDGNKVFKTINGGATWTNESAGLPNIPFNTIVFQNGNLSGPDPVYVGGDIGVFFRNNNSATFVPFNTDLPNVAIRDLEIYYLGSKLRAGTYGRGMWESDLYSGPLPVELTAFEARLQGKNTALLSWNTASEQNNKGFEVEWMEASGSAFKSVGFVNSKGGPNQYSFPVKDLAAGEHYFRLNQLDYNGTSSFSPVRSLTVQAPFSVGISPNPVQDKLTMQVTLEKNASFSVELLNSVGQRSLLLAPREIPKGDSQWQFDLSNLPAGIYYCVCKADNVLLETIKVVKQ